MRVAILEDNQDILDSLALFLQADGHSVDKYNSAQAAISGLLNAHHNHEELPDVVLVAVHLKDSIDGVTVIERLRQHFHPDELPFVLMANSTPEELRILEKWYRDVPLIKKPTRKDTLVGHISKYERKPQQ